MSNEICLSNGDCACTIGYTWDGSKCTASHGCEVPGSIVEPFEIAVGDGSSCDGGRGATVSIGGGADGLASCFCKCNVADSSCDADGNCTRPPDVCADPTNPTQAKCTGAREHCPADGTCACSPHYQHAPGTIYGESGDCVSVVGSVTDTCPNVFSQSAAGAVCEHGVLTPNYENGTCECLCDANYQKIGVSHAGNAVPGQCSAPADAVDFMCGAFPCVNGHPVRPGDQDEPCVCVCDANWGGEYCNTACVELSCVNGTKEIIGGECKCNCSAGWTGPSCDLVAQPCDTDPKDCGAHGRPRNLAGRCQCQCSGGWTGELCDMPPCPVCGENPQCYDIDGSVMKGDNDADIENSADCHTAHGIWGPRGECVNTIAPGGNTRTCSCTPGWTGDSCENPPISCDDSQCAPNGHCINGRCVCTAPYSGRNCENTPNECDGLDCGASSNPPTGICKATQNADGTFTGSCHCFGSYRGADCSLMSDPCAGDNPCQNGGTCNQGANGEAVCTCINGTSGRFCEDHANPCRAAPACIEDRSILTQSDCEDAGHRWSEEAPFDGCGVDLDPSGKSGECTAVIDPTNPAGPMQVACICKNGYSGQFCMTPPDLCNYPIAKDCSGLHLCLDASGTYVAPQAGSPPLDEAACLATDGNTYTPTNCIDPATGYAKTDVAPAANQNTCELAGGQFVGSCVGGTCICNNAGGYQIDETGRCRGEANACTRAGDSKPTCDTANTVGGAAEYITDADGSCLCNCNPVPTDGSNCTGADGNVTCTGHVASAQNTGTCSDSVPIHSFDINLVRVGERRGLQCGQYGDVASVDVNGINAEICVPLNGGRLAPDGRFTIAPQAVDNSVGRCTEDPTVLTQTACETAGHVWVGGCGNTPDGGDQCVNGICNLSGRCACDPGFRGLYCNEAIPQCGLLNLDCGTHGQCTEIVSGDSPSAECRCNSAWTGDHCENPPNPCTETGLDCGGVCLDSTGAVDSQFQNSQSCTQAGNTWQPTGFCSAQPLNPSQGECICTHGYDKQYYPDGTIVSQTCNVPPDECGDGAHCTGDCEKNGKWQPALSTKSLCLAQQGTWHSHAETCAAGRCECKSAVISEKQADGTFRSVQAPAWKGNLCQDSTLNCVRAGRKYCSAGVSSYEFDTGKRGGQCVDLSDPVPLCKDPSPSAGTSPEHQYFPWLLTETSCSEGGGIWTPSSETNEAVECVCNPNYTGFRCQTRSSPCDNHDCGKNPEGFPIGYCQEKDIGTCIGDGTLLTKTACEAGGETWDANLIANCVCLGGHFKIDGTKGGEHEYPSSAPCQQVNIAQRPQCTTNADAIIQSGPHSRCVNSRVSCTDGYVISAQAQCDQGPSPCYLDSDAGNINTCNGHGSCYATSTSPAQCHCSDGYSHGADSFSCTTNPDLCNDVQCLNGGSCSVVEPFQASCTCAGGYSMNPSTGVCDVLPSACSATGPAGCSANLVAQVDKCHQKDGVFQGCDCKPGWVDKTAANKLCSGAAECLPGEVCVGNPKMCVVEGKDGATDTYFHYGNADSYNTGAQKCDHELNACERIQEMCNNNGTPTVVHAKVRNDQGIMVDGDDKVCTCHCDPPWQGEHCDTINPCIYAGANGSLQHRNCGDCGICRVVAGADGNVGADSWECQCMEGTCSNAGGDPQGTCQRIDANGDIVGDTCNVAKQTACAHGACQADPDNPGSPMCACDGQWTQDGSGNCTVPPCSGPHGDCGEHGVCVERGDAATCACEAGFMFDPASGKCDKECTWGAYGANCAQHYDLCNPQALPAHVKTYLKERADKPSFADDTYFTKAVATGTGGECETQRNNTAQGVEQIYPLVYCNGLKTSGANDPTDGDKFVSSAYPNQSDRGDSAGNDERWRKGSSQLDANTDTHACNVAIGQKWSVMGDVSMRDTEVNNKSVLLAMDDKGNSPCGIQQCNMTPCVGSGSTFKSLSGTTPIAPWSSATLSQQYGTSTPEGGVSCSICTSGAAPGWGMNHGSWNPDSGDAITDTYTWCQQLANSQSSFFNTCNDCAMNDTVGDGTGECADGCEAHQADNACFWGWNRYICKCPPNRTKCGCKDQEGGDCTNGTGTAPKAAQPRS